MRTVVTTKPTSEIATFDQCINWLFRRRTTPRPNVVTSSKR
jgi:hypothetical protein